MNEKIAEVSIQSGKKKITLTQLQRFLPLFPPNTSHSYPESISRYMLSPSFSNLSVTEQKLIQTSYKTAYRNYYEIETVMNHIDKITKHKYTLGSIKKAICNSSEKYGLIDWFKFVRKVRENKNVVIDKKKMQKDELLNKISKIYKQYAKKKIIWKGVEDVNDSKKNLQQKLLIQFGNQAQRQAKQFVSMNRIQCQNILYECQKIYPQQMNFIILQKIINGHLEIYMDKKKCMYLYLMYDPTNKGYFPKVNFIDSLLVIPKPKKVRRQPEFLTKFQDLMERIREQMRILYYSANDMKNYFEQFELKQAEEAGIEIEREAQIYPDTFYKFLSQKCENKYSRYQINQVYKIITYRVNLHCLYNKSNIQELHDLISKISTKRKNKRVLKKENQVFYSYRNIILLLLTKCSQDKLNKQQFSQFIVKNDAHLKYQSFYAVWRVYPSLINVQRMRKNAKLSKLACYLKLRKTNEEYEKLYQYLLQQYPSSVQVPYNQVEEKINLNADFVLEASKIKPLPYGDYDKVNYHQAINAIFQPDFQIIIRAYIFRKVAEKAHGLWKARKAKIEAQKIVQLKKKLFEATLPKKKSLDSKQNSSRKLLTQRSKASVRTRKSDQSRMNPESLAIVKANIQKILNQLPIKNKNHEKAFHVEKYKRNYVSCVQMEKYIYRTLNPRVSLHMIPGIIGIGQNLLFLNENKESRIQLTIPYKPGIEVIDFTTNKDDVVLLTSYFILEFFSLSQKSNYPYKSIQLSDEAICLNNSQIDDICEERAHSKYPIFLKSFENYIGINLSLGNNKILIIDPETKKVAFECTLNQKEHMLTKNTLKILQLLKKHEKCNEIMAKVLHLLGQNDLNEDSFKKILREKNENEKGQLLDSIAEQMQELTFVELKTFCDEYNSYYTPIALCMLKQQFKLLKKLKIPDSFCEVIECLKENMIDNNISITMILQQIDKENEGVVMMKSLKDYLLKITQQVYMMNEKQIDVYLKNTVGKFISYEGICEIMGTWEYAIWQRPKLVVKDYVFVKDSAIVIYTVQNSKNIYVRNLLDNKIIGILPDHSCSPTILFIPEKYLLISGDNSDIRIWRIYEDLIGKYDMNPPWTIQQYSKVEKCHDKLITSFSYLRRAHCLVTTSLDSTVKFWQFGDKGILKQVKRYYSYDHYYLTSRCGLVNVDGDDCKQEQLVIGKIQKQINENNKYKYEFTVENYHVQNLTIETGDKNIYVQIPVKMKDHLDTYAYNIGKKKKALLSTKVKGYQSQIGKINLINESLEQNLYNAVKKYYLFSNQKQLIRIIKFLDRKDNENIYKILFQNYGLNIIHSNPQFQTPYLQEQASIHKSPYMQTQINMINLPSQTYEIIFKEVQGKVKHKKVKYTQLIRIAEQTLYGDQLQKLQSIIKEYALNKQVQSQNQLQIQIEYLKTIFSSYELDSDIQKLYGYLRYIKRQLKKKNVKVWSLFASKKKDLQKINSVSTKKFQEALKMHQIPDKYIKFIISFISKSNEIYVEDLLYYLKAAWQSVNVTMDLQNFSQFMMTNSRLIQTKLDSRQIKEQKQEQEPVHEIKKSVQEKLSNFERKASSSKLRQSVEEGKSISKSIGKRQRKSQKRDESESIEKSMKKSKRSESQKNKDSFRKSHPISSSASRVSMSKDQTNDSFKRQCFDIVKGIRQLLKNEGRSIWEITSLSIPYFMEDPIITEQQYFNIFKSIRSPLKLSKKLKLLSFLRRQSSDGQSIDLDLLFQLFEHYKIPKNEKDRKTENWLDGQKYLISYLLNKLTQTNLGVEQAIDFYFFKEKQELNLEQVLQVVENEPFKFQNFCIREFQVLLTSQNKSAFIEKQMIGIIKNSIKKLGIKYEQKKVLFINELNHQINKNNVKIEDVFPKPQNLKVTLEYFKQKVQKLIPSQQEIQTNSQYKKIVKQINKKKEQQNKLKQQQQVRGSPMKSRKPPKLQVLAKNVGTEKNELKYRDFIKYLEGLLQSQKNQQSAQKEAIRKMLKALQQSKINLFAFFVSLDRNKSYFLNEAQFETGLNQLKVGNNFWASIKKKYHKKLYYNEFINYLVEKGMVNYKSVDSDLQLAMSKFIKRYIRNDDIEAVFERIKVKEATGVSEVTYESFLPALSMSKLFKDKQILIIFSAFANAQSLKSSKFSNDDIIKDPSNIHKTFNFKMFTDTVSVYKNQNITKTPHYKFCDYLRKRSISLLNEFAKWMEKNKKIKEVGEAIKNKEQSLPKNIFELFLKEVSAGLTQKQIKQMLGSFSNVVDFGAFNQKIDQIYRKGNSNVEAQQITNFLKQVFKCVRKANATVQRLYNDFTKESKNKMGIKEFAQMSTFLQTGFNKIQNRFIYNGIDLEKKGYITIVQLQDALEEAGQSLQKQEEDYELDFILEKLLTNRQKYALKVSRIPFTLQRACIVFDKLLTRQQTIMVYKNAEQFYKGCEITEKNMEDYLKHKNMEAKAKKDKKYKELVINFLKLVKKLRLDAGQTYHYLSKDTGTLTKNKFIILYQSLQLKASIVQVNSLYTYLDEEKKGQVSLTKWQQKLNMIDYEKQNLSNFSSQQLQVFYKVKVFLSQLYLLFVRKMFKPKQIYSYFDLDGTGKINYDSLFQSINALGMPIDEDMQKRLTNYLDRQRTGIISINNLLGQFESCIGIKMKTVLQTKASCIFKEKKNLIEQKQAYFIQRLIDKEWFEQIDGKWISCILQTDFFDIIKDFGIYLHEDQANDIRRNFQAKIDNLQLYPIYFMFMNIFRSSQNTFTGKDYERQRYNKLFQAMVKNNMTIKTFQQATTIQQTSAILVQLKIFTPIEIKLMVESILFPQSRLIDIQVLKKKLRDSYLTSDIKNEEIMVMDYESPQTQLKDKLRNVLDKEKVVEILKATSGKITQETFQMLLIKLQLLFTKGEVSKYFNAFANNEQYVLIQDILQREHKEIVQQQPQQSYPTLLLDHIQKSLNIKGVSLEEAWQKYYINYGYIPEDGFIQFLNQIGFNTGLDNNKVIISEFINKYYSQNAINKSNMEIKCLDIEKVLISYEYQPQVISNTVIYCIKTTIEQVFSNIVSNPLPSTYITFYEGLQQYLSNTGGNQEKIGHHQLYRYLNTLIQNVSTPYIKFLVSILISGNHTSIGRLMKKIRKFVIGKPSNQVQTPIVIKDYSAPLIQSIHNKNEQLKQHFRKIGEKNFINRYKTICEQLYDQVYQLTFPHMNIYRISMNLLIQDLLIYKQHFQLQPHFQSNTHKSNTYTIGDKKNKTQLQTPRVDKFNLKTLGNLVIQKEEQVKSKGIYIINNQYNGLNITDKQAFQTFALVSNILNPNIIFIRAKNYYLWEPNNMKMPNKAINYRWKYIVTFSRKIIKQLQTVHDHGYCLPHLRWDNLNINNGIQKVLFPSALDRNGNITLVVRDNLFKIQDPYCPPQFFDKNKTMNYKYDSWIFGCLLYEFVWGHPPQSFIVQLLQHLNSRDSTHGLSDVLKMRQYPRDFIYKPFNHAKINQVLSMEHLLKAKSVRQNIQANIKYFGYKGVVKSLQIMYGQDYMNYKDDFKFLQAIMEVIVGCLQPQIQKRFSLSQILHKLCHIQDLDYPQYIQILNNHTSSVNTYKELVVPVQEHLRNKQYEYLLYLINKFKKEMQSCLKKGKIADYFSIPKKYPWPRQINNQHQQLLIQNRQSIRNQTSFNTICLLFNENVLANIIQLYNMYRGQGKQQMLMTLLHILMRIFQCLKRYNTPFVGYIPDILNNLISLLIQQPFTLQTMINNQHQQYRVDYFKIPDFNNQCTQRLLHFFQKLIYVNGYGNIQYYPLSQFLNSNQQYRRIFQYFYATTKLNSTSLQEMSLSINFFRDRMQQNFLHSLIPYLKPQLFVFSILLSHPDLVLDCALFFRDLSNSLRLMNTNIQIFYQNVFYLQLGALLHQSIEFTQIKMTVIEIVINLLQSENSIILQTMADPAFNILKQISRLLVQPAKNTPNHREFVKLAPVLRNVIQLIEGNREIKSMFCKMEGADFVLEAFNYPTQLEQEQELQASK